MKQDGTQKNLSSPKSREQPKRGRPLKENEDAATEVRNFLPLRYY